jgi:hypothetical protein
MQMEAQFFVARDEYLAAIQAHSAALAAGLRSDSSEVDAEYERASTELQQRQDAYRRATENLRSVNRRSAQNEGSTTNHLD